MTNIDTALVERAMEMLSDEYELQAEEARKRTEDFPRLSLANEVAIRAIVKALQSTREKEAREALEMAHALIQEAKGAEGPSGGFVTNHLDAAEHWLDKVEAALSDGEREALPVQGGEWRDIASAPKDTWFLGFENGEIYPCEWVVEEYDEGPPHEGWYDHFNESFEAPTHWMPLPPPPGSAPVIPSQGGEEERARIVAWLEKCAESLHEPTQRDYDQRDAYLSAARAIERCEHLPAQQPALSSDTAVKGEE